MANANRDIKLAAAGLGIKLWQVADALGISDSAFSRMLRRELADDDKAAVFAVIQRLAAKEVC